MKKQKDDKFKKGDVVKTIYGGNRIVLKQSGIQVFVEEEPNNWYHPSKLFKVKSSK